MSNKDDEHFVKVELPTALRAIYARAITKPALARKLVFEHFKYGARDVDEGSSEADILRTLAFCFKAVNTNARDDPAAARKTLKRLEEVT
ncbi:MAG: hypothetical protein AB7O44_29125 [Hyphomicrobiaceae bacterium]